MWLDIQLIQQNICNRDPVTKLAVYRCGNLILKIWNIRRHLHHQSTTADAGSYVHRHLTATCYESKALLHRCCSPWTCSPRGAWRTASASPTTCPPGWSVSGGYPSSEQPRTRCPVGCPETIFQFEVSFLRNSHLFLFSMELHSWALPTLFEATISWTRFGLAELWMCHRI